MQTKKFHNGVLFCGDAIEIMPSLPERSFEAVITDPPYGTTRCKWDAVIPLDLMWESVRRVTRPESPIVLFASQPFTSALVMSNPEQFRYDLVFEKTTPTGHLNAKKMPMRAHESILMFYDKQPPYYPQKTFGHERKSALRINRAEKQSEVYGAQTAVTSYDSTERYPRSVIVFSTDKQTSSLHPTQKPLGLMTYLIRTYTKEGDWILDFACGSGTTCLAASLEGRKFVGIEKEQKYFDIACDRLSGNT